MLHRLLTYVRPGITKHLHRDSKIHQRFPLRLEIQAPSVDHFELVPTVGTSYIVT